jgi:pimeloyl-ACP methyl ester carboxylesterase
VGTAFRPLTEDDTRELVDRCADGSGGAEALKHVGTRTTAKDMDLLREVLGEDQLNFLGQSYGSRLGTVYAEEFPENVRAMILDGAFDPNLGSQDRLLESYVGFQSQFEKMAAFCATQAGCPLGADPDGWTPALQALLQPLAENPIPAGGAELDFASGIGGVMGGLFSPDAWPLVIEGLREVEQGRGDTLLSLSTAIGGITDEGESSNQVDASLAINCVDETLLGADELEVLRENTYDQAPMLDPGTVDDAELLDKCADFPLTGELEIPYGQDIDGLPPTLVVSLTDDPTTPLSGAVGLADTLGGALLTVDGAGHTVIAKGVNACADAFAAAYLIDLELPEEGTTCAAD